MKAEVRIGKVEILLDGSPEEVSQTLQILVDRDAGAPAARQPEAKSDKELSDAARKDRDRRPSENEIIDARSFFREKSPTNNREATAVATYFLKEVATEGERSNHITRDQLDAVFREARWELPKRLDQTLVDTQGAGYLRRTEKGVYELTNTGHNLVVHTLGQGEAEPNDRS